MDWFTYFHNADSLESGAAMNIPVRKKRAVESRLGELLVRWDIIGKNQMERTLAVQQAMSSQNNKRLKLCGEILIELGFAKEIDITRALAIQYRLPYLPASCYSIDPEILRIIPAQIARRYNLLPLEKIGNSLTVSMSNPLDIEALESLSGITNCIVQPLLSTPAELRDAIRKYYGN